MRFADAETAPEFVVTVLEFRPRHSAPLNTGVRGFKTVEMIREALERGLSSTAIREINRDGNGTTSFSGTSKNAVQMRARGGSARSYCFRV